MRLLFIASSLLALAACASSPAGAPAVAAATPAASGTVVAAEDKVVCRRTQDAGALVTHTVCEKQSEMDLHKQEALQEAGRAQQAAHMHPVPGS